MSSVKVWCDTRLVTMVQGYSLVENGAMVIEGDTIVWVGPESELPSEYKTAEFHYAKGRCITPGLIDCHTHLVYAGNRTEDFNLRLQGKSYEEIARSGGGIFSTVNATRLSSVDSLFHQSAKRLQSLLQQGVTTVEIKSGYGLDYETERKMLQVASLLEKRYAVDIQKTFLGAHVLPHEFSNKHRYLEFIIKDVLPKLLDENLVDAVDAFCEGIAFDPESLKPLLLFAQANDLLIKLHAEQLSFSKGTLLGTQFKAISLDHLEYADEDSIKAMQQSGSIAVLLPGAYYFINQNIKPPVSLFRQYNVPMAIATDCNPGTSPTTSLLLMLNMSCIQFGLTPIEALQGVTIHAAHALGMKGKKGQLKKDFLADFVIWDIEHPDELSYCFGNNPCLEVYKNGRKVYEKINTI